MIERPTNYKENRPGHPRAGTTTIGSGSGIVKGESEGVELATCTGDPLGTSPHPSTDEFTNSRLPKHDDDRVLGDVS